MSENVRPLLASLACINPDCDLYGQVGQENLTVRKVYGKDRIRYLRCRCCGEEFSERKNTALWNTKIPEHLALDISHQLAKGMSLKATARLTHTHRDTVRRLRRKCNNHAQQSHDQQVQNLLVSSSEIDDRSDIEDSKDQ